jgi:hypothetical protein
MTHVGANQRKNKPAYVFQQLHSTPYFFSTFHRKATGEISAPETFER